MITPGKILIFRLSSIGDIILTTALVRCIKETFPESQITFVIKKEFHELIRYNTYLSNIITFEKKSGFKGLMKLRKEISCQKFDWFIDIHRNIRSNLVKQGQNIPLKTTYSKHIFKRFLLVYFKINLYRTIKPVLHRYFESVEKQGVFYDGKGTDVFFAKVHSNKVEKLLEHHKTNKRNLAVICPGASYQNKQWKLDGFAQVATYLAESMDIIFLGGNKDFEICRQIIEKTGKEIPNLAGKTTLLESAAILGHSKLTITNDSGMMHMAQSQKNPVVAIFGPTTRELGYFPMPEKSRVVEKDIPCRPCTHKGLNHCPKKHFRCMESIESKDVIGEVDKILLNQQITN